MWRRLCQLLGLAADQDGNLRLLDQGVAVKRRCFAAEASGARAAMAFANIRGNPAWDCSNGWVWDVNVGCLNEYADNSNALAQWKLFHDGCVWFGRMDDFMSQRPDFLHLTYLQDCLDSRQLRTSLAD